MFDKIEYEYYITINGEEVKADDCFGNMLGYTSCEVNDNIYRNIDYRMVEINRINGYYDKFVLLLLPTLVPYLMIICLKNILKG